MDQHVFFWCSSLLAEVREQNLHALQEIGHTLLQSLLGAILLQTQGQTQIDPARQGGQYVQQHKHKMMSEAYIYIHVTKCIAFSRPVTFNRSFFLSFSFLIGWQFYGPKLWSVKTCTLGLGPRVSSLPQRPCRSRSFLSCSLRTPASDLGESLHCFLVGVRRSYVIAMLTCDSSFILHLYFIYTSFILHLYFRPASLHIHPILTETHSGVTAVLYLKIQTDIKTLPRAKGFTNKYFNENYPVERLSIPRNTVQTQYKAHLLMFLAHANWMID